MSRKKSVPSYRRHASGQARVTINGRDYLLGPHGSPESRAKYAQKLAEWSASDARSVSGVARDLTVAELLIAYLEHAKKYYGTGPTSDYKRIKPAVRTWRDLYAEPEVNQFGPEQYKAVRQKFIDKGHAGTYVNSQMKLIRRCIKWGVSEGLVQVSVHETLGCIPPLKRGRSEAKETKAVRPVADHVIEQTLGVLPKVVADMVRIQLLVGCRAGEVCRLTPGMIDRGEEVWQAELSEHKTAYREKSRTICFGPKAQEILRPYLLRAEDDCLFRPCDSEVE